jgi:hypothetical protein
MAKFISNPERILINIFKAFDRFADFNPKATLGSQIPAPGYPQQQFWLHFIKGINEKFSGVEFKTQDFWQACIKQEINPFHVLLCNEGKSFKRTAPPARLISFDPAQGVPPGETYFGAMGHMSLWDEIFRGAFALQAPYEFDPLASDEPDADFHDLMFRWAVSDKYAVNFFFESVHYDKCLGPWAEHLKTLPVLDQQKIIGNVLLTFAEHGLKIDLGQLTPRNQRPLSNRLGPFLDAVKGIDLSNGDAWSQIGNMGKMLPLHYPEPQDRLAHIKAIVELRCPHFAVSALKSLFLHPEYAVEALSGIDQELALEVFGATLSSNIGNKHYNTLGHLDVIVPLVETYRELFKARGYPDIIGHPCLDYLCCSLEVAEHFAERSYIRQHPSISFEPGLYEDKFTFAGSRLAPADPDEKWMVREDEVERVVSLLSRLGAVDSLMPAIETLFKTDKSPVNFAEGVFPLVVVELINRQLIEIEPLIRTDLRLRKAMDWGVSAQTLQDLKIFKKNQADLLGRDLGL